MLLYATNFVVVCRSSTGNSSRTFGNPKAAGRTQ